MRRMTHSTCRDELFSHQGKGCLSAHSLTHNVGTRGFMISYRKHCYCFSDRKVPFFCSMQWNTCSGMLRGSVAEYVLYFKCHRIYYN